MANYLVFRQAVDRMRNHWRGPDLSGDTRLAVPAIAVRDSARRHKGREDHDRSRRPLEINQLHLILMFNT
jgi:hypothetical protein